MAGDKKERLLKAYLEKKAKLSRRDELFKQINALSQNSDRRSGVNLLKTKLKKSKERSEKKRPKHESSSEHREVSELGTGMQSDDSADSKEILSDMNEPLSQAGDDISRPAWEDENIRPNAAEEASRLISEEPEILVARYEENTAPKMTENEIDFSNESFQAERCERTKEMKEAREKLAIFYEEHEIVRQVKAHRIVFIQGDTGCGKTTQIPQFLLENGFRAKGLIGITQPRRFAAISAAARINTELNGKLCGYKIKYENSITSNTRIKVMTEGILLREIQLDFFLSKYSVIILDEVHERTVNMDVLLGLLSKIVGLRFSRGEPLRLILMSATANAEDYHAVLGPIHQISLKGHSYKVSVFYESKTEENYVGLIEKRILEILDGSSKDSKKQRSSKIESPTEIKNDKNASILVFLPTKQDIYSLKQRLENSARECVVLPLHSSLSREEQLSAYKKYDLRKVILATNVAETSITIDDVVFVIDSGRVKEKMRSEGFVKYQVGFVSKSSAIQRMGRAGRTGPGVCLRMYCGKTYESFQEKNRPQIYMEPLDGTLLQLKMLGIENIFTFPFISPVDSSVVREAVDSLQNLGALDTGGEITSLGRKMAAYSIAPRYARLLCVSTANGIFHHIAVAVSILSVGFEVVKNKKTEPYFNNERSDIVVYMKLYYECINRANMRDFARKYGLSAHSIQEVTKLSNYLISISGGDKQSSRSGFSEEEKKKICKTLYFAFSDQLAVSMGASYISGDSTVFTSNDSVIALNENVVFDHIACGRTKDYMKNITIVEKSWFKAN